MAPRYPTSNPTESTTPNTLGGIIVGSEKSPVAPNSSCAKEYSEPPHTTNVPVYDKPQSNAASTVVQQGTSETTAPFTIGTDTGSGMSSSPWFGNNLTSPTLGLGNGGFNSFGNNGALMMGSPYYGMMMPPSLSPIPTYGPLSGLNQFLFGIQNVIFSLGQAIQIMGMNTHAVQQLFQSAAVFCEHAISTWQEMQTLDNDDTRSSLSVSNVAKDPYRCQSKEAEEQRNRRRRRLRALRWALMIGVSYTGYKIIGYICQQIFSRGRQRQGQIQYQELMTNQHHDLPYHPYPAASYMHPFPYSSVAPPPSTADGAYSYASGTGRYGSPYAPSTPSYYGSYSTSYAPNQYGYP